MLSNTFFLAPFLPPIQLGLIPKIVKGEFEALLQTQLSEKDLIQLELLKLRYEIEKVRIHDLEIEEKPDFVNEWLEKYETKELRKSFFHELLENFYEFVELEGSPFIKAFFREEREISEQFLYLRRGEKSHSTPDSFIKLYEKGPMFIEKGLIQYKFNKIDEWIGLKVFTSDAILAYAAKYYLNEETLKWDHEKGEMLLNIMEKGEL